MSNFPFLAALAVASTLLLVGCSPQVEEASGPAATDSPSIAASSAAPEASVARWAGLIAERKAELDDWYAGWDDATCSALASAAVDCNLMLTTASFLVQTNDIVIAGASDTSGNTYLGSVPDEISGLYSETIALTGRAVDAGSAWAEAGCGIGDEGECIGLAIDFERAIDAVQLKFEAWSPYL